MTAELNAATRRIPLPQRMRNLPISKEGYVVPWFVAFVGGEPDFRAIRPHGVITAHKRSTCWLCGHPLGKHKTFVIGPMCAVNRNTAEPPCHLECAEYAAKACPFLTKPAMRRNKADMPDEAQMPAGVMIERNPGVVLLWTTKRYDVTPGPLFRIGIPEHVEFYCQGRTATRHEIMHSIDTGMPILLGMAKQQGRDAEQALNEQYKRAIELVPAI